MKKEKNIIKVKGINMHPNTTIEFLEKGLAIYTSLNIEEHIVPYIKKPFKVYKGECMWICSVRVEYPQEHINHKTIAYYHNWSIKKIMKHIRECKSIYYKNSAKQISNNI